jgi:hypothetical protein
MKFSTYAQVVKPDDFRGGAGGILLKDLIEQNGGRYEHVHILSEKAKKDLRRLAELTSNQELAKIADRSSIAISLEHLRGLDPDTTRIRVGSWIQREATDGDLPGFDR